MLRSNVRRWWRTEFDYGWLPAFLDRRSLSGPIRAAIGIWCAIFGICAVLVQFSDSGPRTPTTRAFVVVLTLSAFYAAVRWPTMPWPTERKSLWFVCWTELGLAVAVLFGTDERLAALPGCGLFVVIGMYVTLLHSPRVIVAHLAWALTICIAVGVHVALGPNPDVPVLAGQLLVLMGLIVLVPLGLHVGVTFLKEDARDSYRDPLTDLLNRRGVEDEAQRLLGIPSTDGLATVVMVIDLDSFKRLNDANGHAGGDLALRAVARRLADVVPAHGLVGRLGGDEFTVVLLCRPTDIDATTERIHNAVYCSDDRLPITASTGAWILTRSTLDSPAEYSTFEGVLAPADLAMYEAKKAGGNRLVRCWER
ncbi:GGDEF domain-containing protein [Antrihabitans sp. YC3-6]|uniref:GGDEF domain-containing protein n=1 Tax=Antrihabitans stalagmiti TaxID=2799499 RepID=A0A934U0M5_9NOCA|nr:GGDEF domain-containing protein [Antrihabitans stalagmiti]MBJ8337740.1 GGDEF domain-containing protein [Antrihabitans stalagmiti]